MAIVITIPNKFKTELGKGSVDFSSDTFKMILMGSGFVFDPDTDGTYADISADEITSAGGYTVGGTALTVDSAWAQDNANDKATIAWNNCTFTASGADYDTFCAGVIVHTIDSTTDTTDLVVCCIAIGTDIDVTDGLSFIFQTLGYDEN